MAKDPAALPAMSLPEEPVRKRILDSSDGFTEPKAYVLASDYDALRSLCQRKDERIRELDALLDDAKSMLELWPLHEGTTAGSPAPAFKLVARIDAARAEAAERKDKP